MTDPVPPPEDVLPPLPSPPVQQVTPENLVEQTLERAAGKVASVTVPGGPPVMNRMEAIASVVAILIILAFNILIDLRTYNATKGHREDFQIVCQLLVERAPQEQARDLASRLAECLK